MDSATDDVSAGGADCVGETGSAGGADWVGETGSVGGAFSGGGAGRGEGSVFGGATTGAGWIVGSVLVVWAKAPELVIETKIALAAIRKRRISII
ncbi:hypothetical protein PsB1_2300 [Candidatus Phycosocius spiralis]|uniref:Uncharacterized protein n=1 Tax=Candidatus Phycosocius spiralis TaxID=2815099 RepID=A0ABQ4PYW4_9PROT|nr:hypothetical protein PsB1_2300 [Candidatus Phycosocius spiralis]